MERERNYLPFEDLSFPALVQQSQFMLSTFNMHSSLSSVSQRGTWGNASVHGSAVTVTMEILIQVPLYVVTQNCQVLLF